MFIVQRVLNCVVVSCFFCKIKCIVNRLFQLLISSFNIASDLLNAVNYYSDVFFIASKEHFMINSLLGQEFSMLATVLPA